jgi:biotin transport system substrate-specific component
MHKGQRQMAIALQEKVLTEGFGPQQGTALWVKQGVMVLVGIIALAVMAKIKVPVPGSPVAISMGTFAVLTIAAAYGPRLGLATIMGWLMVGMLGFDVFQSSTADLNGLSYMMGSTGGYLVGYVLATLALGFAARAGWDRSVVWMALAMLIGNALIYVPGLAWLGMLYGWDQPILAWGLTPFLLGDALKLGLAALIVPGLWKVFGAARH